MTTTAGERIGGWLLAPLAWLLVALLSASLALGLYSTALITPHALKTLGAQNTTAIVMWFISFAFAKAFAFSPVSDALALRQLLVPLLVTALFVPYFKRSARVKNTFVNP